VGDQGAALAAGGVGQGHGRQLPQRLQFGQAAGVVLVGLALPVGEPPGLAVGVGHLDGQPALAGQVGGPAGVGAGLDDDQRPGVAGEQTGEVGAAGVEGVEGGGPGGAVVEAGDALEPAEVDGENGAGGGGRRAGRGRHGASPVG
jgi:hypothetical protein